MSKKGTVILLAALVALCAAYWGMIQLEKHGEAEQARSRKVFDFAPEDIRAIEIQQVDGPAVAAERAGADGWAITKPGPDIEPNVVVWDRAANTIAALDNIRTIDAGGDLAAYGLDKPVLKLTATPKAGKPLRFEFGNLDPTQAYRYARLNGEQVFLVSVDQFHEMDRSPDLLRDRRLFKSGKEGITRLELTQFRVSEDSSGDEDQQAKVEQSVTVAVERQPDGRWVLVSPEPAPANQETVNQLVREVQYSMILGHIEQPEALEDYGLDPPRARLTVYTGAGSEPQTVFIGMLGEHGEFKSCVFAQRKGKPGVILMDPNVLMMLPRTPNAFREDRLFTRDASRLLTMEYESGSTDVKLENDPDKGWVLVDPAADDTDQIAVSNFISFLKQIAGESFPKSSAERLGFDDPRIAIRFTFRDEPPSEILVGAPVPGTGQFYARQDNGSATILSELEVQALTITVHNFRQKTLLEFDKNTVQEVKLTLDGKKYEFEKHRGRWAVVFPENSVFSSLRDMDPLVDALSRLRADKRVADEPGAVEGTGLDKPVATVRATVQADGEDAVELGPVTIGAATAADSQHRYATSAERPGLYLVKQALVDEIRDTVKAIRKR